MINEKLKKEILNHVEADYPKEACGVIILKKGKEKYIPCNNLAEDKYEDFVLDPKDFYKAAKAAPPRDFSVGCFSGKKNTNFTTIFSKKGRFFYTFKKWELLVKSPFF